MWVLISILIFYQNPLALKASVFYPIELYLDSAARQVSLARYFIEILFWVLYSSFDP